jgi:hypothetical protein
MTQSEPSVYLGPPGRVGADRPDNAPKGWNPSTAWEAKVKSHHLETRGSAARFRHAQWKLVFEKQPTTPFTIQAADPLFSYLLGEESVKFTYWMSKDAIWKRYSTLSQIAVLEPAGKEVSIPPNCITGSALYQHSNFALPYQTSANAPLHYAQMRLLISVAERQEGGLRGNGRR